MRTAVENRVYALLARQGIRPETCRPVGKAGREFLASLGLPEGTRRRLDALMSLIGGCDGEITAATSEINARRPTPTRVCLCSARSPA